tara:strand:- start:482 stop:1381 length:900 start_codon:yes stop_codon:yes gene_type:complete
MNAKNKMLFFRTVANEDAANGIDDQLCVPVSRFVSMSPASATTLDLLFRSVKNNDLSNNSQLTYDKVTLTVTQGDIQEVMDALVSYMNSSPNSNGFIVIADDCATTDSATSSLDDVAINPVYAHPSISGIASITVADKLYRVSQPMLGTGNVAMTAISATELSVNTHYKGSTSTNLAMTLPSAADSKAGDWITVTYTAVINNGQAHTYTTTTDTTFAAGSLLIGLPGADETDGTRVGRVVESDGSAKNVITLTGLTDGDGGIGTTLKFVNMTGTTNGWACEGQITHQGNGNAAATFAFS